MNHSQQHHHKSDNDDHSVIIGSGESEMSHGPCRRDHASDPQLDKPDSGSELEKLDMHDGNAPAGTTSGKDSGWGSERMALLTGRKESADPVGKREAGKLPSMSSVLPPSSYNPGLDCADTDSLHENRPPDLQDDSQSMSNADQASLLDADDMGVSEHVSRAPSTSNTITPDPRSPRMYYNYILHTGTDIARGVDYAPIVDRRGPQAASESSSAIYLEDSEVSELVNPNISRLLEGVEEIVSKPSLYMSCAEFSTSIDQHEKKVYFANGAPPSLTKPPDSDKKTPHEKKFFFKKDLAKVLTKDKIDALRNCNCGDDGCFSLIPPSNGLSQEIPPPLYHAWIFLFYNGYIRIFPRVLTGTKIKNSDQFFTEMMFGDLAKRLLGTSGRNSKLAIDFLRSQCYKWHAPVFCQRKACHYPPDTVPPIFVEKELGKGANGCVYKAFIPPGYHNLDSKDSYFALKTVFQTRSSFNDLLSHPQHDNINPVLCIYYHNQCAYTISPLASDSLYGVLPNLNKLYPSPTTLRSHIIGCFSGLAVFHQRKDKKTNAHRDLKPSNILVHLSGDVPLKWTISDLDGSKEIRVSADGRDSSGFSYCNLGRTFAAPEAVVEGKISCRGDLFAIACVFLVVYVAYNVPEGGMKKFEDERRKNLETWNNDRAIAQFWGKDANGDHSLLPSVQSWLDLIKKDPVFGSMGRVWEHMMCVDRGNRWKTAQVMSEMKKIMGETPGPDPEL